MSLTNMRVPGHTRPTKSKAEGVRAVRGACGAGEREANGYAELCHQNRRSKASVAVAMRLHEAFCFSTMRTNVSGALESIENSLLCGLEYERVRGRMLDGRRLDPRRIHELSD